MQTAYLVFRPGRLGVYFSGLWLGLSPMLYRRATHPLPVDPEPGQLEGRGGRDRGDNARALQILPHADAGTCRDRGF